ncbi:hypothetical protein DOTSEDRAFT_73646 [Dothistroma septosporum NZE10]|uniref:Uncharacterized protein n=1 Tax=Dothistroma septosporum (strain NZE10 / CBS 128990) TaxID=675120 RepID=N1PIE4_DOTSN|nr:hypothetical protein DOTSEDRAFT_73646 [Dothistroma septosporum NZE10]
MANTKPLKLYGHASGPNPTKVVIILEELKVPYEIEYVDFSKIKQEPFISVNPNGRVPAIQDPNTGITLWESGAIIECLIDTYDKDCAISYSTFPEKYLQSQWKHLQMSGQGPYFGQAAWFQFFHSEKNITSAIDRYKNEIKRIISVIDLHLTKTGKPYLVGDKVTFADLMFVPWNIVAADMLMGGSFAEEWQKTHPKAWEWHQSLASRASVEQAQEIKAKARAEGK